MTAKSKKPIITDVRGSTRERVYTTIRGVLKLCKLQQSHRPGVALCGRQDLHIQVTH